MALRSGPAYAQARRLRAALHARPAGGEPAAKRCSPISSTGPNGPTLQTRELAIRTANAFRKLGVKQGDRVLVWLPNSADCLRVWFGLNYLGAVFVPINLAYRGSLLQHAVNISEARLGVIHAELHQRLGEIAPAHLREIVVLGGEAQAGARARTARSGGAGKRRHRPAGAGARDRAVGSAVDHLHQRHHRAVEGRAVVLRPSLQHGDRGAVPLGRRSLHAEPAAVPFRRRDADDRDADPRRLDRDGRRLRHRHVLGHGAPARRSPPRSCSASWAASCSSARRAPTTRTTPCAPAPMCRSTRPRGSSTSGSAPTSTRIST